MDTRRVTPEMFTARRPVAHTVTASFSRLVVEPPVTIPLIPDSGPALVTLVAAFVVTASAAPDTWLRPVRQS